jgi:hypothetical protein
VCANEWSPSDGRVVTLDHGCGAHSETDMDHPEPPAVGEPIVDEFAFDLEPAERSTEAEAEASAEAPAEQAADAPDEGAAPAEEHHGSDDPVTD